MVDTVKLLLLIPDPMRLKRGAFAPLPIQSLVTAQGMSKTYINPSPIYAKTGRYMPRLTLTRRPMRQALAQYYLAIEFSAPKMLFGNNFSELVDNDFRRLLSSLSDCLYELLDVRFTIPELANADVTTWHPAKNIVFTDFTSCQTILNTIAKLDISKIYDIQKTDFREGHVFHIHCNSLDIAFYDKVADLRKSKTSSKRAVEKDGLIQLGLLGDLNIERPFEVLRYEVRLGGKASIKRNYPDLSLWTFETLFNTNLSQRLLIQHWRKISDSVNMLSLDIREPYELLQNYLIDNPSETPQTAMAAVTGLLINGKHGVASLRNLLESHYGKQAWYRLKPLLVAPSANRLKHFRYVDEALTKFRPILVEELVGTVEYIVK